MDILKQDQGKEMQVKGTASRGVQSSGGTGRLSGDCGEGLRVVQGGQALGEEQRWRHGTPASWPQEARSQQGSWPRLARAHDGPMAPHPWRRAARVLESRPGGSRTPFPAAGPLIIFVVPPSFRAQILSPPVPSLSSILYPLSYQILLGFLSA